MSGGKYINISCPRCEAVRSVREDYAKTAPGYCRSCACSIGGSAKKPSRVTGTAAHCKKCSKSFWQYKHKKETNLFCSQLCVGEAKRVYPKEIRACLVCASDFLRSEKPHSNSTGEYCSIKCRRKSMQTGVNVVYKPTKDASRAMYAVSKAIKSGALIRPEACEQCEKSGVKIEGAHFNYEDVLNVRWLCVSCHRAWDNFSPKGGTERILVNENRNG